jgi:hypothetical protein
MTQSHVPLAMRRQIIEDAGTTCGYCHSDEVLMGVSMAIDHIVPIAAGGQTVRDNLWVACRQCNEYKGAKTHYEDPQSGELVPLFNPRTQKWHDHFTWDAEYTHIIDKTATGRATIEALELNRTLLVRARQRWVLMGWRPFDEA